MINRVEKIDIDFGGTVGLSASGHGVVFDIPGDEREICGGGDVGVEYAGEVAPEEGRVI